MELRRGYKQTEVGVIPEEWDVARIGNLCAGVFDCHHSTPVWTASGLVVIRNQNIRDGKLELSEPSFTDEKHYVERTRRAVPSFGDLVITREAPMGLVCMIPEGLKCCLGQRMVLLRPNQYSAETEYFLYALLSEPVQRSISVAGGTGSTVSNLRIPVLKNLAISAPPLPEQRAIATALSDVGGLLGGLDRLIAKKRDIKQAAMQQLLTGKTRLPGFHGEWEAVTMRQVITQNATYGIVTAGNFVQNGVKMLRSGDIADGRINTDLPMVTREKAAEYARTALVKDDVVIALVGYPGASAKIPEELIGANISRAVGLLRMNGKVSAEFLVCFLNSPDGRRMVLAPSAGSAQQVVNLAALDKLQFVIPSVLEQTAIAEVLTEMDTELAALQQRRAKTRALKQAMMQELLTGRTRLVPAGGSSHA